MFGPSLRSSELLCPRLTSANPSRHLSMPVVHDRLTDLPGYCALTFPLMPAPYTCLLPYRYRTLKIFAFSSSLHASYEVSVRRTSALPAASFRFHLAMDTLAVRLTIPPVGLVGDFHPRVSAPCRAHENKKGGASESLTAFLSVDALVDVTGRCPVGVYRFQSYSAFLPAGLLLELCNQTALQTTSAAARCD